MIRMDNDLTGEDALTHSIDLFQDLAAFTKEYRFYNKQIKSPFMSFLSLMGEQAPNRFPKTFGLVHRKKQDEINIRSFYIPKDYIEPLATGIHFSENLRKLDLSRTQLSNDSCHLIINSIPFKLRELALSHNKAIQPDAIELLCEVVLTDVRYYLDTLILENCELGDEAAEHIGNTLK